MERKTTVYSNPVKSLEIDNWPIGRNKTAKAIFTVETKAGKGERVSRVTIDENGRQGKPQTTTYSPTTRIMTGDDNLTYVVTWNAWQSFYILHGTLKTVHESLSRSEQPERYQALFDIVFPS